MEIEKLCIYCMNDKGGADECPYCRRSSAQYKIPMHALPPGSVLNDRYYIGAVIGQGGFGITYAAYDTNLNRRLAIKEFFPRGQVSREDTVSYNVVTLNEKDEESFGKGKSDFLNEARMIARFTEEQGVVSVFDYLKGNQTVYIIMEYLDGVSLKTYLKSTGTMPYDQCVYMLMPIMRSLDVMHRNNLLHRDISPDNIMLTDRGAKLIDFGAARDFVTQSELSVLLKRSYAPYEQYSSTLKQGPYTDIYALCATMYRCITGHPPPEATQRLVSDTLQMPSELGFPSDPEFERVLAKGLGVMPENRFSSMGELISALWGVSSLDLNIRHVPDTSEMLTAVSKTTQRAPVIPAKIEDISLDDETEASPPILMQEDGDETVMDDSAVQPDITPIIPAYMPGDGGRGAESVSKDKASGGADGGIPPMPEVKNKEPRSAARGVLILVLVIAAVVLAAVIKALFSSSSGGGIKTDTGSSLQAQSAPTSNRAETTADKTAQDGAANKSSDEDKDTDSSESGFDINDLETDGAGTYIAAKSAKMYAEPNTSCESIGSIGKYKTQKVLGSYGDMYYVDRGSRQGFVKKSSLKNDPSEIEFQVTDEWSMTDIYREIINYYGTVYGGETYGRYYLFDIDQNGHADLFIESGNKEKTRDIECFLCGKTSVSYGGDFSSDNMILAVDKGDKNYKYGMYSVIPHSEKLDYGSSTYIYIDKNTEKIVSRTESDDDFHTIEYLTFYSFDETDILRKADTSVVPETYEIESQKKLKSSPLTFEIETSDERKFTLEIDEWDGWDEYIEGLITGSTSS